MRLRKVSRMEDAGADEGKGGEDGLEGVLFG